MKLHLRLVRGGGLLAWAVFAATVGAALMFGCGGDSGGGVGVEPNTPGNGGNSGSVETVMLGGKKWMKKNLNVQTADSRCYGEGGQEYDSETGNWKTLTSSEIQSNCNKYGRLYTWEAAEAACQLAGSGWRLPTREDWNALAAAVGGDSTAGKHLKSRTGWTSYSGIENLDTYGFSALPGGYRRTDGSFYYAGYNGYWWTASADGSGYAYYRLMYYRDDYVFENINVVAGGLSVRCVGD